MSNWENRVLNFCVLTLLLLKNNFLCGNKRKKQELAIKN